MASDTGKAIIFNGAGKPLEEKEFPIPKNIDPEEVLVQILLSTVCSSDVHTWLGHRPFPTPSILGHEMVGKIIVIGKNIVQDYVGNKIQIGDRIVWSMTVSCGECYFCTTAGLPQKCLNLYKYGHVKSDVEPYFTGGYAKYIILKKGSYIFKVPSELSDEETAPLMCAASSVTSGLDAAHFSQCDYVVIQGCGALGLYTAAFTKELGAKKIIVVDVIEERLQLAKQFGADYLINAESADVISSVLDITEQRGADYVIEVTGSSKVIEQGIKLLRIGGKYILLGAIYPGNNFTIDSSELITKCLEIFGRHNYAPSHLETAIKLVQNSKNKYPYSKLVGPDFEFSKDGVEMAFKSLENKESIRPKIIPK